MLAEQNGYCLHLDCGKWIWPPAFPIAKHSKVQSPWSHLEETMVGLRAMCVLPVRGQGGHWDLAV